MTPLHETLEDLLATDQAPVYVVHFTQAAAIERAQALMSINVRTRAEKDAIAELIGDFRFAAGLRQDAVAGWCATASACTTPGMLPKYRRLVERLAQAGLLKVICGTDTLGVGVNVPIRTVLFTALSKYDGTAPGCFSAREFHQIAGRAGRAGFDTAGDVVVPGARARHRERAGAWPRPATTPKKRRKVVRTKPPEGFVGWGETTFDRLVAAEPEPLTSQLRGVARHAAQRARPAGRRVRRDARSCSSDNHEPRRRQRRHIRAGHRHLPVAARRRRGRAARRARRRGPPVRLTVDLQLDFALNQPLSPFALAALDILDPECRHLRAGRVSVIEADLDDPRQVLVRPAFKARGEAVAAMKAEGIEYEERMALLDEVDYPKPLADLLEVTYEAYRQGAPVGRRPPAGAQVGGPGPVRAGHDVRRLRRASTALARSEGMVLRYLADAYKALRRTVPEDAQDRRADRHHRVARRARPPGRLQPARRVGGAAHPELDELACRDRHRGAAADRGPRGHRQRAGASRVMVRNALFRRVELAGAATGTPSWASCDGDAGLAAPTRWADAMADYWDEYDDARHRRRRPAAAGAGPDRPGRPRPWRVRQIFDDPAGDRDWGISAEVDLAASDEDGEPVLTIPDLGPLTG